MFASSPYIAAHSSPSFSSCYVPWNSSPLAATTHAPRVPFQPRRRTRAASYAPGTPTPCRLLSQTLGDNGEEAAIDVQKRLFREKKRERYAQLSSKARERVILGRRWSEHEKHREAFSDGVYSLEIDEDDDDVMQDELFRRIMRNEKRKQELEYDLSYQREFGSFDLDAEDLELWERDANVTLQNPGSYETEILPHDLELEEVAAYAEEYTEIIELEGLTDKIFSLSDVEGGTLQIQPTEEKNVTERRDADVEMKC